MQTLTPAKFFVKRDVRSLPTVFDGGQETSADFLSLNVVLCRLKGSWCARNLTTRAFRDGHISAALVAVSAHLQRENCSGAENVHGTM
jgi:hypothetical protein